MKALVAGVSLLLSLVVPAVQGQNSALCTLTIQAVAECAALQCPLQNCTLPESVDSCQEAQEACQAASSCCGGGCGMELEALVDNCVPDLECGDVSCTPQDSSQYTYDECVDSAEIIDACNALNRTCARQTNADGGSREFCDQCKNGTIWNFVSDTLGDCYPIEEITFDGFLKYFNPLFEDDREPAERAALLKTAALVVSAHNSQIPRPSYFLRINRLGALTEEEFDHRNGVLNPSDGVDGLTNPLIEYTGTNRNTLPESVDWSDTGAVTSVKDQGQCGCCWSIAAVGAIEAAVWRFTNGGFQKDLSWQQLVSCDKENFGCNGGNVVNALQYTLDNAIGGVTSYAQYPFTDANGDTTETCADSDKTLAVDVLELGIAVSSTEPANVEDRVARVKEVLAKTPMAVLMSSDCPTIQHYHSGILTDDGECACNSVDCIDHAVLMVGYDDTTNPPSFKMKNSWSSQWGENGYFRVAQTVDQNTMQYGLFGILFQGSGARQAVNTTVAPPPSSASARMAGSVAIASAVLSLIVLDLIG